MERTYQINENIIYITIGIYKIKRTFFAWSNIFWTTVPASSTDLVFVMRFKWFTTTKSMDFIPGEKALISLSTGKLSTELVLSIVIKSFSRFEIFLAFLIPAIDVFVLNPSAVNTDLTGNKSNGSSSSSTSMSFQNFGNSLDGSIKKQWAIWADWADWAEFFCLLYLLIVFISDI